MKKHIRYLSPKSPLSERGLAIASLKVFNIISLFNIRQLITLLSEEHTYEKTYTLPLP